MPEPCPRCHATLPPNDGTAPAFCPACGLPQLRVPLEALESIAAREGVSAVGTPAGHTVEWRLALRILAVASFFGILPCLFQPAVLITGGAGVLALLLLPLLTLGSGAAYLRRRPFPPFTPAMGARMGSVLALLLAVVLVVACGGAGFTARNFMHSRLVPGMLDLAVQQTADRMTASGTPLPPDWATAMHWPEMRAGAFLLLQVFLSALLLLVGTVSGAAAGALLGARQRRNRT